jgi:hypothetical protein
MHHALLVDDIITAVIQQLHVDEQPENRATLAALAMTCRALNGRATDVLWAEPPIFYLARQMSKELWINEESPMRGYMHHRLICRRIGLYCTCIYIANLIGPCRSFPHHTGLPLQSDSEIASYDTQRACGNLFWQMISRTGSIVVVSLLTTP